MRRILNYTKFTVSLIALILTMFVLTAVNQACTNIHNNIINAEHYEEIQIIENIDTDEEIEKKVANTYCLEDRVWEIEIPIINLNAQIEQDTTQEVMKEYVGHFTNTTFWKGNIGLAAHNRRFSNKLF